MGHDGVRPLPYRLPELLGDPDATVFIAEGEKDCDNLGELGLVATCNHGGAGRWSPDISRYLANRRVVILPDNDEPGRAHARGVAAKLAGIAASIRVIELPGLPPKGDVSDWLAAGGSADGLDRLAASAADGVVIREPFTDDALGEWDAGDDDWRIPPREWLLGSTFCRRFVSSLLADGAVGKTSLRIAQLLSCAIGRPLTGEHVFRRCRVLLVSFEDDRDELRRRVRAAMLYHNIDDTELKGWLFLASIGQQNWKLVRQRDGSAEVAELRDRLVNTIRRRQIDIVSLDPFVKIHAVEENSNDAIDCVVSVLASIADEYNCAVDAPHHTSKGPANPGNADRGRGASAFKDGGRLVYTLAPMAAEEAELFNVPDADRRLIIRVDSAKVNIARPAADARWFKLVGVPLSNGTALYPNGDEVQTVEPWEPPDFWRAITPSVANQILDQIEAGFDGGRRYSPAPQAKERAAWPLVQKAVPGLTEKQAKAIIASWLKSGLLESRKYHDLQSYKDESGLFVSPGKRPG